MVLFFTFFRRSRDIGRLGLPGTYPGYQRKHHNVYPFKRGNHANSFGRDAHATFLFFSEVVLDNWQLCRCICRSPVLRECALGQRLFNLGVQAKQLLCAITAAAKSPFTAAAVAPAAVAPAVAAAAGSAVTASAASASAASAAVAAVAAARAGGARHLLVCADYQSVSLRKRERHRQYQRLNGRFD